MAEAIIDGRGEGYFAGVTDENRLLVDISGATINIGSVSANVDSIYVQSGNISIVEEVPTADNQNNALVELSYISSGTSTGLDAGSAIGSIIKFIDAGSYVKVLSYINNNLTNVGSWI